MGLMGLIRVIGSLGSMELMVWPMKWLRVKFMADNTASNRAKDMVNLPDGKEVLDSKIASEGQLPMVSVGDRGDQVASTY